MPKKSATTTTTEVKTSSSKKSNKKTTPSQEASTTNVVVAPPAPTEKPVDFTQVDAEVAAPEEPDQISLQFDGIVQTLATFRQSITALQTQIRGLEKCVRKEIRTLRKEATKNRNKGNRKPSGFAKPSKVSDELCMFMKKEKGTEIARTEVTQFLIKYINDNSLQFAENKKVIIPDETLKKLLGVKDGEEVTYFNLQKYMNKHFHKKTVVNSTEE